MGREVMQPRGLVRLGLDTLDASGPEVREALAALLPPAAAATAATPAAASSPLPALVHCTQGKDRTGLVVALALMALGRGAVPLTAVRHDYMLTGEALAAGEAGPDREARLAEVREIGLGREFGDVAPDLVERLAAHLDERYGGLEAYLDGVGFGEEERQRLREALLY